MVPLAFCDDETSDEEKADIVIGMLNEGAVIGKEEVLCSIFSDFRLGLQSLNIEEFAICLEVKVNTNLAFTVCIIQHSREYNAEQGWS